MDAVALLLPRLDGATRTEWLLYGAPAAGAYAAALGGLAALHGAARRRGPVRLPSAQTYDATQRAGVGSWPLARGLRSARAARLRMSAGARLARPAARGRPAARAARGGAAPRELRRGAGRCAADDALSAGLRLLRDNATPTRGSTTAPRRLAARSSSSIRAATTRCSPAARVYAETPDPARSRLDARVRLSRSSCVDPNRRWPWLAHAALLAKHRLHDLPLARRYAAAIDRYTTAPDVPLWARQMEIFILEDMNELEAARIMLGGLLESGDDPRSGRGPLPEQRLEELEASAAQLVVSVRRICRNLDDLDARRLQFLSHCFVTMLVLAQGLAYKRY